MQSRRQPDRLGLYIHFPYCIQKCAYCDFYSVGLDRLPEAKAQDATDPTTKVSPELLENFENSLLQEWEVRLRHFTRAQLPAFKVDSVFFGGGTASLMPAGLIAKLLQVFQTELDFAPEVEITLEGNPENFTPAYLRDVAAAGVNRINAGLQTFQPAFLKSMHRYYDAERYASILGDLSQAPVAGRGVDLIYGFAGQTMAAFQSDLEAVLAHNLNHLSVYSLTVEQATPYANAVARKASPPPDEDLQLAIFEALPQLLKHSGLEQYEVSNFAKPGHASRHNLRYWYYEPCLALGPGAHGFDGKQRYANSRSIPHWQGQPTAAALEPAEPLLEFPLSYLRLSRDLRLADFQSALAGLVDPERLDSNLQRLLGDWHERALIASASNLQSFDWTMQGQLQLDSLIFEMSTMLSELARGEAGDR